MRFSEKNNMSELETQSLKFILSAVLSILFAVGLRIVHGFYNEENFHAGKAIEWLLTALMLGWFAHLILVHTELAKKYYHVMLGFISFIAPEIVKGLHKAGPIIVDKISEEAQRLFNKFFKG